MHTSYAGIRSFIPTLNLTSLTKLNMLYGLISNADGKNSDYLQLMTEHAVSLSRPVTSTPQSDNNEELYSNHDPELLYDNDYMGLAPAPLPSEYSYTAVARSGLIRPKGNSNDSKDNIELKSCVAYGTTTST